MGLDAHATHLWMPDRELGRVLAGALLRSRQSLVITPPYGRWLNVYLPMGVSYKDVPDLPTAACLEINCYNSEGLDLRLYAFDRLEFLFESGCSDVAEEEDALLEIAARIWERENPDEARRAGAGQRDSSDDTEVDTRPGRDFWSLGEDEQRAYVAQARRSDEFQRYKTVTESSDLTDAPPEFEPYLPPDRTLDDLQLLLNAIRHRLHGAPRTERDAAILRRWMDGKTYSPKADDYVEALARFFDLKGSLWTLETIQQRLADRIDRRIVPLECVQEPPATTT